MKCSMSLFRRGNCLDFVLLPLIGALFLSALSIIQKLYVGLNVWNAASYVFPGLYGSIAGGLVGLWSSRLRRVLHQQINLQQRYYDLFENASDLIQAVDLNGAVIYVNRAWKQTLGYDEHEIKTLNIFDVIQSGDRPHCQQRLSCLVAGEEVAPMEVSFRCKDGQSVLLEGNISLRYEDGEPHSIRGIFRNISERKEAELKIHQLAYYDTLTGLPNRILLQDRLIHAITDAKRFSYYLGVLFIDLDQFKKINDTLGHSVGDELLKQAALRLRSSLRENDTAARLGGDEFVIILSGFKQLNNVPHIAQKLLDCLAEPYFLAGRDLVLSGSIGIAVYPQDGENAELLMRNADMAMYAAKNSRGSSYRFFSEDMNETAARHLELEGQLRHAIQHDEFEVYYQPQVDWQNKTITGVEALVRWIQPQKGMVPPDVFIPIAEETGLIVELGEWVLRQACQQIVAIQQSVSEPLMLSVNLSGRQFDQPDLVQIVQEALGDSGLAAEQLELEITETILMENAERARDVLLRLSKLGVKLAIDDFGMGYSSLNYLKHFPLERLKIDKSFLVDVIRDDSNAAIVQTIVSMAATMRLDVIAEGVETLDQVYFLQSLGCLHMQGYLFSEPLPYDTVCSFLRQGWSV